MTDDIAAIKPAQPESSEVQFDLRGHRDGHPRAVRQVRWRRPRARRVPAALRPWLRNKVMGRAVPFTGTAGLDFAHMAPERVEIAVANVRRVQNHIQGVHAAAMALLAETATGMVVGMNVRDDCLPLCKTLHIDFKRRAQGGLRAVARLSPAQRELMLKNDKGDTIDQGTGDVLDQQDDARPDAGCGSFAGHRPGGRAP